MYRLLKILTHGHQRFLPLPHRRSLFLEELEQRDVPAPVAGLLPGQSLAHFSAVAASPAQPSNPAASTAPNAAQALAFVPPAGMPTGAGNSSNPSAAFGPNQFIFAAQGSFPALGLPTVTAGSSNISSLLFSGSVFPVAPDAVRTARVSPAIPGAGASLASEPRYIVQDITLSGGGGQPDDGSIPHTFQNGYQQITIEPSAGLLPQFGAEEAEDGVP